MSQIMNLTRPFLSVQILPSTLKLKREKGKRGVKKSKLIKVKNEKEKQLLK